MNWLVIGISGYTNSGKTSLCRKLKEKYEDAVIVGQDQFFREVDDPNHVWVEVTPGKLHQNWELHSAINWNLFEKEIQRILSSKPSSSPGLLFLEGHVIFNHRPFKKLFHERFFLELTEEECRRRRYTRTYDPADPENYFDSVVYPMTISNRQDFESYHDAGEIQFIDGSRPQEIISEQITNRIEQLIDANASQ
ncbi:Nicotinamide riboside kinase 1 [Halotydeus destructor]|nr:Nicotinamide riboside kinase 1 [Halotydeus destructor]